MILDVYHNHTLLYMIFCSMFGQNIQRGSQKKKKKSYSSGTTLNNSNGTRLNTK
ncbi:uncharacterized protein EURHEDRAFT_213153 [Aspergillus ruber CBS 135680]|uniref:Uncharacterized protein n=1 Tax=Aspergillus ruber (strain CBS 135680) TaxID=1388766 RepID=A0A017SQE3_ASPRC|nr:uncharacterized protein EURHEDRAFT_213153 [Aspergillus ruber CBS 135680]EYE98485.1 hypothetical protein EURHEDRAFT_213153 [Aspergillus ruber CBS 135680]